MTDKNKVAKYNLKITVDIQPLDQYGNTLGYTSGLSTDKTLDVKSFSEIGHILDYLDQVPLD